MWKFFDWVTRASILIMIAIVLASFLLVITSHAAELPNPKLSVQVILVPDAELRVISCGAARADMDRRCGQPLAAYSKGIIYLSDRFNPKDPQWVAILQHELTHHAMRIGGMAQARTCQDVARNEAVAYAAQRSFLEAQGISPQLDSFYPGPLALKLLTDPGKC